MNSSNIAGRPADVAPTVRSWIDGASNIGARSHRLDLMTPCGAPRATEVARFHLQAREQLALVRDLIDGPIVILKGIEVAQVYPEAWQRDFVDLDLLVDNLTEKDAQLRASGFEPFLALADLPAYHQTAPLVRGTHPATVELHGRPNSPEWAHFPSDEIIGEARPSRTGVPGLLRPRDDHHAVILAWHYWSDGARHARTLVDLHLLRRHVEDHTIEETARRWRVGRIWRATQSLLRTLENGAPADCGTHRSRLLRLEPVNHRAIRARQLRAIAMGGPRGAVVEFADRLVRRRQRDRLGA